MEDHISERESPQKEVVLIDSLLSIDQYKCIDRSSPPKKHMRDIAEVAAAAEMLLPKGSSRITTAVRLLNFAAESADSDLEKCFVMISQV